MLKNLLTTRRQGIVIGGAALLVSTLAWRSRSQFMVDVWAAIASDNDKDVQRYIDLGGDLHAGMWTRGMSPAMFAIKCESKSVYKTLMLTGTEPNRFTRPPVYASVMTSAASSPDPYWIQIAVECGGDPNLSPPASSRQPRPAVYSGSAATLRVLCESGLDVNHVDKYGESLLVKAAMGGEYDKVLVLLNAGANYNLIAEKGAWLFISLFLSSRY